MKTPQDEDPDASLAQVLETGRGRATVAAELVALLSMVPFMVGPPRLAAACVASAGSCAICGPANRGLPWVLPRPADAGGGHHQRLQARLAQHLEWA